MNASSYSKARGTNLCEVSRRCGVHRNTLYRWYESETRCLAFKVMVAGTLCMHEKYYSEKMVAQMMDWRFR